MHLFYNAHIGVSKTCFSVKALLQLEDLCGVNVVTEPFLHACLSPVYLTKGKTDVTRETESGAGSGQLEARRLVSPVRSPFQMGP